MSELTGRTGRETVAIWSSLEDQSLRGHRKYSPSRSESFTLCPGSVNYVDRLPAREPDEYSSMGTKAHEILQAGLLNRCENATQAINASVHCCEDFDFTFKGAINDALDYVWSVVDDLQSKYGDAILFVERYVDTPSSAAPGEAGGFCDIAIYSPLARRIWIIDYKHGEGIAKAAEGNTQVMQYGAGFLFEDLAQVDAANIDLVTLVIIQPRAYHQKGEIREYHVTPAILVDYLMDMDEAIERCKQPDAPLVPGVDQCRFCDGRSSCPALARSTLAVVNPDFMSPRDVTAPRIPDPKGMDLNQLAYAKQIIPLLRMWISGVEGHAEELAKQGVPIPGHKLVESHARREWYGTPEEVAAKLSALAGVPVEDVYVRKLMTITDAEKLVVEKFKSRVSRSKRKAAAEDANKYFAYLTTKQSSGSLSLVPMDDPRPPANKAAVTFSNIPLLQPPTK